MKIKDYNKPQGCYVRNAYGHASNDLIKTNQGWWVRIEKHIWRGPYAMFRDAKYEYEAIVGDYDDYEFLHGDQPH